MALAFAAGPLAAAEADVHWAYAAFFGTGRYQLDGVTETTVVGFAPAWAWREAALDETGNRRIGYRFRVPVALGATEFESLDLVGDVRFDSIDAFSLVPGVEVEIPLTERVTIKPLGYVGFGLDTGGDDDARIFRFGFRGERRFSPGATSVALVSGIERLGFSPDQGQSDAMTMLQTGLDFGRTLERTRIADASVVLHWHIAYTRYIDTLGLDIRSASIRPDSIGSEWELGMAFAREGESLRLWRLKFDRFGLAYRFESGGKFSGVSIVFRSLFDR